MIYATKRKLTLLLILWLLFEDDSTPPYFYGYQYHKLAQNPGYGISREKRKSGKRRNRKLVRVWEVLRSNYHLTERLVHMTPEDFEELMEDLRERYQKDFDTVAKHF
jgi:hypothetical protein